MSRPHSEIEHGRKLSQHGAELIWGWGTPAGKVRAMRRAELIAHGARLGPGVRALEIGCGTGLFTELFAETGAHITAVDISRDLLKEAWNRGLPKDRVVFVEKPFEECEVDGPFDAVIGSSILHHLDLGVSLPRMLGLLRPGGRVSFAEPNMLNPQILLQKNIPWLKERLGDSPDETAFVRFSLEKQLRACGFEGISIKPFDWLHPFTPRRFIHAVSAVGRLLEAAPLMREFAGSLSIRCRRPDAPVP
jgi:2-polyprenyl-3-methyl-5-hydroxy-6-metoxy-1,4-benzoquinol methylase